MYRSNKCDNKNKDEGGEMHPNSDIEIQMNSVNKHLQDANYKKKKLTENYIQQTIQPHSPISVLW